MKFILTHSASFGWRLLAEVLIVVAVLLSLSRLASPFANEFRGVISEQIEALIQHPVSLENIQVSWAGIKPRIRMINVSIGTRGGGDALATFDLIRMKLNPWRSLLQGRLVPERLILQGSQVEIVRSQDGRLLFRGFERASNKNTVAKASSLEQLAGLTLQLRDIRLLWNDEVLGQNFQFLAEQLDLGITDHSVMIDSRINLPDSLGETVHLIAKAEGSVTDLFSWHTEFYLRGQSIDIEGIPFKLPRQIPIISDGELDLEIWGDWKQAAGIDTQGKFSAHGIRLEGSTSSVGRYEFIDEISSRVRLTGKLNDWQLDLDKLQIVTAQRHWPSNGLSLAYRQKESEASRLQSWRGHIDFVDAGELKRLVALSPTNSPANSMSWVERLSKFELDGELKDFDFVTSTDNDLLNEFHLQGAFENFSWVANQKIPSMTGINGSFSIAENGGDLLIHSTGSVAFIPQLFAHDIHLDTLEAEINWQKSEDRWLASVDNIHLKNKDLSTAGTLQLETVIGEKPRLDLEMFVPELDVEQARNYIPYDKIRSPKARLWLKSALKGGTAKNGLLSYRGELSKQAFKSQQAKLTATFEVNNGRLHYRDGWPDISDLQGRLSFNNSKLKADIKRGRLFATTLGPVDAEIENLFLSRLKLKGNARGDVSDTIRFLRESPLVAKLSDFLDQTEAKGDAELELALQLPLSRKLKGKEQPVVNGSLLLSDTMLAIPEHKLRFGNLSGALAFSRKNFQATGLTAHFRGSPITGRIDTDKNGEIKISARGLYEASDLLPPLEKQLKVVLQGNSEWRGELTIPPQSPDIQQPEPLFLELVSELRGTTVSLPSPLYKVAEQLIPFKIGYQFGEVPALDLKYGKALQFNADLRKSKPFEIERGILKLSENAHPMPSSGVAVTGQWPSFSLKPWIAIRDKLKTEGQPPFPVTELDLSFPLVQISKNLSLNQTQFKAARKPNSWLWNVQSKEIAGAIEVPQDWKSGDRVLANLEYFKWTGGSSEQPSSKLSPIGLPAIDAKIDSVQLGHKQFDKVLLKTSQTATGVIIDSFEVSKENFKAQMGGNWVEKNGSQHSDISMEVISTDVGAALESLGFKQGLAGGEGELTAQLGWNSAPNLMDLAAASGQIIFNITDGKFDNIEPGIGRLFSLTSLNNLPRRLSLDFRDVSEDGFNFDSLSGTLDVFEGDLLTQNMRIKSSLADISFKGKSSLASKLHDMTMEVTPKIKSSVPVAAGLLAGPQTGALIFLVDKLAESVGVDFNKTAARSFSITGSWNKPVVDSLQDIAQEAVDDGLEE